MHGRIDKLFGGHRFRYPNGHTNEERALTIFSWISENYMTLFQKGIKNTLGTFWMISGPVAAPCSCLTGSEPGLSGRGPRL